MPYESLNERGIQEGATSFGSPSTLKNTISQIQTGHLLDHQFKDVDSNPLRQAEINKLEGKIHGLEEKNNKYNTKINQAQKGLSDVDDKLMKLRIDPQDPTVVAGGVFSWAKFLPLLFVFLGLSAFLFFYYSGVPFEAFNTCSEETKMFPSLSEYLQYVLPSLYILIAFVFFAFGLGMHYAFESPNKLIKALLIAFLILITFALDLSMSLKIHECLDLNNFLMTGEHIEKWYKSYIVYTLFFLGFVTFFLWSFLYIHLQKEIAKKNPKKYLQNSKISLTSLIDELMPKRDSIQGSIDKLNIRLKNLNNLNIPVIVETQIEQSINLYKSGFYQVFNNKHPDLIEKKIECDNFLKINSFEEL